MENSASSLNSNSEPEQPTQPETQPEQAPTAPEPAQAVEEPKIYLKAMPLRDIADIETVKEEVNSGNIVILKITPLANKNISDVSRAVNELYAFAETINGDIARLGEERIVVCPPKVRIWREKKPAQNEPLPTAA